jgi:hypothetical protein
MLNGGGREREADQFQLLINELLEAEQLLVTELQLSQQQVEAGSINTLRIP